jgi:NADH-quinone oxidoreductase subunit J
MKIARKSGNSSIFLVFLFVFLFPASALNTARQYRCFAHARARPCSRIFYSLDYSFPLITLYGATMSLETAAFFVFAVGGITTAILMITRKSSIPAALCLIGHFFCLSGLYLTLQAQLLAALQILVYAGAIMVLIVFVIMLLNLGDEAQRVKRTTLRNTVAITVSGILALQLVVFLLGGANGQFTEKPPSALAIGGVAYLGRTLYTDYVFAFEAVSMLLLTAVVGAVVIAKRKLEP